VIVGFPGETEEEFEQTRRFLEEIQFYEMHIFKYSRRKGTKADTMPNQVAEEVKNRRSDVLLALAQDMSFAYRKEFQGREVETLLETPMQMGDKQYYTGYTKEYIRVAVETEQNLSNRIVTGRVGEPLDRFFTFSLDYIKIKNN
jgi:threonylcarbamoyladenosine tRNA methylthiotransferase MtaB